MSYRVVCEWVERSEDGRALHYAHQTDYETTQEAWAAFFNEQTIAHPGGDLQIDLLDRSRRQHLSKWTPEQGTQPDDVKRVSLKAITDLAEQMRKRSEDL